MIPDADPVPFFPTPQRLRPYLQTSALFLFKNTTFPEEELQHPLPNSYTIILWLSESLTGTPVNNIDVRELENFEIRFTGSIVTSNNVPVQAVASRPRLDQPTCDLTSLKTVNSKIEDLLDDLTKEQDLSNQLNVRFTVSPSVLLCH